MTEAGATRTRRGAALLAAVGFLFVLLALVRYTSWSSTTVLGRWSGTHFILILVALGGLAGCLVRGLRPSGRPIVVPALMAQAWVSGALFLWGTGLLLDSLDDPQAAGRLARLRPLASNLPAAMLLEWLAMVSGVCAGILAAWRAMARRRRSGGPAPPWCQNALLAAGSLGALLLLLEGGTRVLNILNPMTQGFPTKASKSWERRFVRLNSLGFRDREPSSVTASSSRRILLVGDSFTFGWGIDDTRERLGERLESALNRSHQTRFEVINAGVPDADTLDDVSTLRRMLAYRPDYVLLIYVFNDIEHAARPAPSLFAESQSHWQRLHPARILVLNSHLAEQLFIRLRKASYRFGWSEHGGEVAYEDERVWAEHLQALQQFFRVCRQAGVPARLVPFDPRVSLTARARYEKFVKRAEAAGIPVWSLADAFAGRRHEDLQVNRFDAHPNGLANGLAASVIIERFRSEFLAQEASP